MRVTEPSSLFFSESSLAFTSQDGVFWWSQSFWRSVLLARHHIHRGSVRKWGACAKCPIFRKPMLLQKMIDIKHPSPVCHFQESTLPLTICLCANRGTRGVESSVRTDGKTRYFCWYFRGIKNERTEIVEFSVPGC